MRENKKRVGSLSGRSTGGRASHESQRFLVGSFRRLERLTQGWDWHQPTSRLPKESPGCCSFDHRRAVWRARVGGSQFWASSGFGAKERRERTAKYSSWRSLSTTAFLDVMLLQIGTLLGSEMPGAVMGMVVMVKES